MIYMICYDISNPKRLQKTARTLENFGLRVQKSFFQCEMSAAKLDEVRRALLGIINLTEDSLFIYPLCEDCSGKALTDGQGDLIKLETFEIL